MGHLRYFNLYLAHKNRVCLGTVVVTQGTWLVYTPTDTFKAHAHTQLDRGGSKGAGSRDVSNYIYLLTLN